MSKLTRLWKPTFKADGDAKVMEHQFSDGTLDYTMRDRLGRPHNIDGGYEEAMQIVKQWKMEEVQL